MIMAIALGAPLAHAQEKTTPVDVTGKWQMTIEMDMGTATPTVVFKQDGEKLTGTYTGRYGEYAVTGKVSARTVAFSFAMGEDSSMVMSFTGSVAADGQAIKGTADMGELGKPNWSAARAK